MCSVGQCEAAKAKVRRVACEAIERVCESGLSIHCKVEPR